MTRPRPILILLCCLAAATPARAGEHGEHGGGAEKKKEVEQPRMPGVRPVQMKKTVIAPPKPLVVEGPKGAENYCGAIAATAASTRLAWQEQRVKAAQAEMVVKITELEAKEAEVRDWVARREQLLAKAAENLTAIYAKMKPEAAASQLSQMDDNTAAAILLKLKPATASAVMTEMDPARAARLSDLLTGAEAKSEEKKS